MMNRIEKKLWPTLNYYLGNFLDETQCTIGKKRGQIYIKMTLKRYDALRMAPVWCRGIKTNCSHM
jgi:hypothetical protein